MGENKDTTEAPSWGKNCNTKDAQCNEDYFAIKCFPFRSSPNFFLNLPSKWVLEIYFEMMNGDIGEDLSTEKKLLVEAFVFHEWGNLGTCYQQDSP
ncbi:hypothetical protein TNCV_4704621 [Trichonephila clavipes]|nr:hypothetical protein TNCV_4704621 [Trichonephila clavipes]